MDEVGIKAAVLTRLRARSKGRPLPIVTSEFSLTGTGIRADLAVLSDTFTGIEIKSDSDSLKRLPSQVEGYARYFDKTELVVAPRHLRGLRNLELHGAWIWRYDVLSGWQLDSTGQDRHISGQWLLHLLPAHEEKRASRRVEAIERGGSDVDHDNLQRNQFVKVFRQRYGPTSDAFWATVRGRRIVGDDLKLLSRFHANREHQQRAEEEASKKWAAWAETMQNMAQA